MNNSSPDQSIFKHKWYHSKVTRESKNRAPNLLPLPMLENLNPTTIMPACKLHITLATVMLNILQRRHHVRNAAETAAETGKCSPPTIPMLADHPHQDWDERQNNLLCRRARNRLRPSHLPIPTRRTIDRGRRRLKRMQWCRRGISTRMPVGRIVHLRVWDLFRERLARIGLHVCGSIDGVLGGISGVYMARLWLGWVCFWEWLRVCGAVDGNGGYVVAADGLWWFLCRRRHVGAGALFGDRGRRVDLGVRGNCARGRAGVCR